MTDLEIERLTAAVKGKGPRGRLKRGATRAIALSHYRRNEKTRTIDCLAVCGLNPPADSKRNSGPRLSRSSHPKARELAIEKIT